MGEMPSRRRSCSAALARVAVASLVAAALPLRARAEGVNVTQAESLYNQGKELIEKKQYKAACDKFSASLKLDENTNTQVALARCFQLDGRTASAWGQYLLASKMEAGSPAAAYAAEQASALGKTLLNVSLVMASVPRDLSLKLDDESLPAESVNADLPLDPGEHQLVATAAGKRPFAIRFVLSSANSPLPVVIALDNFSAIELQQQQENSAARTVIIDRAAPNVEWTSTKTAGFVVGGVGAASALGAAALGVLTLVSDANRQTQSNRCVAGSDAACASANDYRDKALTFQKLGIISGAVGGAALITGIAMMVAGGNKAARISAAPKAGAQLVPVASPTLAGLGFIGAF